MREINIIYGPPGTGKTHTLLEIVEKEVSGGVPLDRLAYVSFTKKATTEVQERMCKKFDVELKDAPHFRTIHSMTFRGVGAQVNQMMDPAKYQDFGKKAGYKLKGYYNSDEGLSYNDDDNIMLEQLYRNNRAKAEKYLDAIDYYSFIEYMKLYAKYKRTFNYLDFTDLLDLYIEMKKVEDVDVAIIDEAQDLTTLQWRVVMQAFSTAKRIYIAGDDDQSIYGFAGADTQIFTHMKGSQRVLEQSYRLPQTLVDKAKVITKQITNRIDKTYYGREGAGKYKTISHLDNLSVNPDKSYYMLARNNFLLKDYIEYCKERFLWFSVKGKPYVSESEYKAYLRDGIGSVPDDMKEYMAFVHHSGCIDTVPKINIGTIHSVKGGEADVVVLRTDVSRGIYKQLHIDEDDEHRCFYVGVTRAKKEVILIEPQTKYSYLGVF